MNTRGYLIPPHPDAVINVDDGELGLLYQVKSSEYPVFLYAGPPTDSVDRMVRDPRNYERVNVGEQEFPAVLMGHHNEEVVGVQQQLQPGQHVIARLVPGVSKDIYEVTTFKHKGKKVDDMPESGSAVEILNKGYVLKKHIKLDEQITETFQRVRGDIFPNDDLTQDVKQSIFGDCFLLSSVLAILEKPGGVAVIKGMMKQDGNHTIVRLYDPNTLEPVYYRIENTRHYQNDRCTVKHLAPWVHILEKAFTAHALKKNDKGNSSQEFYYSNPSFRDMFGDGGKPATAMTILTGEHAHEVTIHRGKSFPWDQEGLIYSMSVYNRVSTLVDYFEEKNPDVLNRLDEEIAALARSKKGLDALKQFAAVTSDISGNDLQAMYDQLQGNLFGEFVEGWMREIDDDLRLEMLHAASHYVSEYIKLCIQSPLALSDVLDRVSLIASMGKFVKHDIMAQGKWEDFEKDVNVDSADLTLANILKSYHNLVKYPVPEKVKEKFRIFAEDNAQSKGLGWDGELGSGLYTQRTQAVFDGIAHHFENNDEILAASTRNTFPKKIPGLRPQHAYAITGVSEEDNLKFVHVRNPWGRMGRRYYFKEQMSREHTGMSLAEEESGAHSAESKIELSDFVRYFGDYTVGSADMNLALQQAQRVPPPSRFRQKHISKTLGAAFGALLGAAIGAAIGFALLPFTFGVSVPLFAAIGAVVGGAILGGLTGGLIGGAVDRKRNRSNIEYAPLPSDDTDTESAEYGPSRRQSLSPDETKELAFERKHRSPSPARRGMFVHDDKGKSDDERTEEKLETSPRKNH